MLNKRETPQSIEWHEPKQCEEIIEAQPYDYANQPDDLPSVEHWYKVRDAHIFQQERMANL